MRLSDPATIISTILKHDRKINTYKFALIRSINSVVLSFLDLKLEQDAVAVPLRMLAEYWFAYYYPFVAPDAPIYQGVRANNQTKQDMSFRKDLTEFRALWETKFGKNPADGFFVIYEFRLSRSREAYDSALIKAFQKAIRAIVTALQMPIRYAGPAGNEWSIFSKPQIYRDLQNVIALPQTQPDDLCLVIPNELWMGFQSLSLWIEALCIHEWSLFVGNLEQAENLNIDRGVIYELLTEYPENRRSLEAERKEIGVLMRDGAQFICPWTYRQIINGTEYDLDHLMPLAIYPSNALWNLVPADAQFNRNTKRDKLASQSRLQAAIPDLAKTYENYQHSPVLSRVLKEDLELRFTSNEYPRTTLEIANRVTAFMLDICKARNVAEF